MIVLVVLVNPVLIVKGTSYAPVAVKAAEPSVPPLPIFNVLESVPLNPKVLLIVRVLLVVPPATLKPVPKEAKVNPFTEVGTITPRVSVIAGVVVEVATEPDRPFAVTTETSVTDFFKIELLNIIHVCYPVSVNT